MLRVAVSNVHHFTFTLNQNTDSIWLTNLQGWLDHPAVLCGLLTRLYKLVSSANKCTGDATTLGMSLMKQANRSGPNSLPWGMPLVTLAHVDLLPFTTTLWR